MSPTVTTRHSESWFVFVNAIYFGKCGVSLQVVNNCLEIPRDSSRQKAVEAWLFVKPRTDGSLRSVAAIRRRRLDPGVAVRMSLLTRISG